MRAICIQAVALNRRQEDQEEYNGRALGINNNTPVKILLRLLAVIAQELRREGPHFNVHCVVRLEGVL